MKKVCIGRDQPYDVSSSIVWDAERIVLGPLAFQELKQFFQSIEFRKGDKIRSAYGPLGMLDLDLYVVDFNHEAYFCVSGNGQNYTVKFEHARGL